MIKLILSIALFICCILYFIFGRIMYKNQQYKTACYNFFFLGFSFILAFWVFTEYLGA